MNPIFNKEALSSNMEKLLKENKPILSSSLHSPGITSAVLQSSFQESLRSAERMFLNKYYNIYLADNENLPKEIINLILKPLYRVCFSNSINVVDQAVCDLKRKEQYIRKFGFNQQYDD